MHDVEEMLRTLVDPVPGDLVRWFSSEASGCIFREDEWLPYAVPLARSVKDTLLYRSFHPLVIHLQGIALDELGTSDRHFYMCRREIAGAIFFVPHDGYARMVYASLADYGDALTTSQIEERIRGGAETGIVFSDQAAIAKLCESLLHEEEDERDVLLPALIPSLDLKNLGLLERIAGDESFFVVQALAEEIARRPAKKLGPIAERCSRNWHMQAAAAGKKALATISRLK